jgi:hypothetical protein
MHAIRHLTTFQLRYEPLDNQLHYHPLPYFSAAWHALRNEQGHLPDYRKLVTPHTGFKKITKWVIERGMLGEYLRAQSVHYPPGLPSPAKN